MTAALLEVTGVTKRHRRAERPAVERASLQVGAGECVGLVGESGAGKTTLADCVAGLEPVSDGEVRFDGQLVSARGRRPQVPRVRGIQLVFQDPSTSLNPRRTVGSVLAEILRVHRLRDRGAVDGRVTELLELVGLASLHAERRPRTLSGGQRQRVAIARALAFEPRLIVADEVVSALDASVQAQILNLLADLRERLGLAVLFVAHDLSVVRQLCDRIVVMRDGQVVEDGRTDDVLTAPAHPYTQALLAAVPRLRGGMAAPSP